MLRQSCEILRHNFFLSLNDTLAIREASYVPYLDAIRVPLIGSLQKQLPHIPSLVQANAYHGTSFKGILGILNDGYFKGENIFVSRIFGVAFRGYGSEANLLYQLDTNGNSIIFQTFRIAIECEVLHAPFGVSADAKNAVVTNPVKKGDPKCDAILPHDQFHKLLMCDEDKAIGYEFGESYTRNRELVRPIGIIVKKINEDKRIDNPVPSEHPWMIRQKKENEEALSEGHFHDICGHYCTGCQKLRTSLLQQHEETLPALFPQNVKNIIGNYSGFSIFGARPIVAEQIDRSCSAAHLTASVSKLEL